MLFILMFVVLNLTWTLICFPSIWIQYACRKTLADSRPRIRGRFARNEEIDQKNSPNVQWSQMSGEEDEEDGDGWINLLDAFSSIESIPWSKDDQLVYVKCIISK